MKSAERKEIEARRKEVNEAVIDERVRVNQALKTRKITISTGFGPYELDGVTTNYDYITHPAGEGKTWSNQRTFAGCNDGTWAKIMSDAGEKRNRTFAKYAF